MPSDLYGKFQRDTYAGNLLYSEKYIQLVLLVSDGRDCGIG